MKEVEYPSGEVIRLDYDAQRGFPIGETAIDALGNAGTTYRSVKAMSARGMATVEQLGNGVNELSRYDDSTGLMQVLSAAVGGVLPSPSPTTQCSNVPGTIVRCTEYKYDQLRNLVQQSKHFYPVANGTVQSASPQVTASETYQYDDLQRIVAESRGYVNLTPNSPLGETYSYDDTGNILSKIDFDGAYLYGDTTRSQRNAGPHAVLSVGSARIYPTMRPKDR